MPNASAAASSAPTCHAQTRRSSSSPETSRMTSERHNVRLVDRADEGPLAVDADAQADRADWRSSSLATAGLTILIGIWPAISPALFDYKKPALPVIWGLVILV